MVKWTGGLWMAERLKYWMSRWLLIRTCSIIVVFKLKVRGHLTTACILLRNLYENGHFVKVLNIICSLTGNILCFLSKLYRKSACSFSFRYCTDPAHFLHFYFTPFKSLHISWISSVLFLYFPALFLHIYCTFTVPFLHISCTFTVLFSAHFRYFCSTFYAHFLYLYCTFSCTFPLV